MALKWLPPPKSLTNGLIRFYSIAIHEINTGDNYTLTSTQLVHVVNDLHPYYTYHFTVQATTVLSGPPSEPIVITTPQSGKYSYLCLYVLEIPQLV